MSNTNTIVSESTPEVHDRGLDPEDDVPQNLGGFVMEKISEDPSKELVLGGSPPEIAEYDTYDYNHDPRSEFILENQNVKKALEDARVLSVIVRKLSHIGVEGIREDQNTRIYNKEDISRRRRSIFCKIDSIYKQLVHETQVLDEYYSHIDPGLILSFIHRAEDEVEKEGAVYPDNHSREYVRRQTRAAEIIETMAQEAKERAVDIAREVGARFDADRDAILRRHKLAQSLDPEAILTQASQPAEIARRVE